MDINGLSNQEAVIKPLGLNTNNNFENLEDLNEDGVVDYTDFIMQQVFVGDTPYTTIKECIQEQFEDYINMEDTTNYVDLFYDQYDASAKVIEEDENDENSEGHIDERKEALLNYKYNFISFMSNLFKQRLMISIVLVEDEKLDDEDIEVIIRSLYEFFILNACNNFKVVIAKDMEDKLVGYTDEKSLIDLIIKNLGDYVPLFRNMTPTKFLELRKEETIAQMYDECTVTGNFMKKYTPKLYQNEEFKSDLINYIIMVKEFKEDLLNGGQGNQNPNNNPN